MTDVTAADKAMQYALQQLGKPYVWGGTGPNGFDCSGLMQKAYQAAGVDIPRTSQMQSRIGQAVGDIKNALPGDLVFPYIDESHVAMYLGNNNIVEAPQTGIPVHVVKYYASAGGIRRIVQGGGAAVSGDVTSQTGVSQGITGTSTFNNFTQSVSVTVKDLTNPKEWASLGFIVLGIILVVMVIIQMIGKEVF